LPAASPCYPSAMGAAPCVQKVPCFSCCDEGKKRSGQRALPQAMLTLKQPGFDVELAVSALAGMKGAAGYHTSVLVAAEEYFFSPLGIVHSPVITSHKSNPEMKLMHMGLSRYSGMDLIELLDQHFAPGHYDLLRKNCNTFSDCALYFLCEQRLDMKFRSLEALGKLADDHSGMIQKISGGEYLPNPCTVDFDVEDIIRDIKAEREVREAANSEVEYANDEAHLSPVFAENDFLQQFETHGPSPASGAECEESPDCWRGVRDAQHDVEQDAASDLVKSNPFRTRLPQVAGGGA